MNSEVSRLIQRLRVDGRISVNDARGFWVERNYGDDADVALLRLDEIRRGHRVGHGRSEAFDERLERVGREGLLGDNYVPEHEDAA